MNRVWIPSPNYSYRGAGVRLVVLHTAEGSPSYQSLGAFFANPSSGVSSHVGIDDTPGTIGEYVRPEDKAWTAANANPYAIQAELCAFASWSAGEWDRHQVMLDNTAQWISEECARFSIPLRTLSAAEAQSGAAGVCQHADLGAWGGGHWDCGPNFPMADVMARAAGGAGAGPTPDIEEGNMIASTGPKGYFTCTRDGAVYAFGDAQYAGNAMKDLPKGRAIVGIAAASRDGYWLLSDGGDLYTFGSADYYGKPDRV